jgi:hypothetical protein
MCSRARGTTIAVHHQLHSQASQGPCTQYKPASPARHARRTLRTYPSRAATSVTTARALTASAHSSHAGRPSCRRSAPGSKPRSPPRHMSPVFSASARSFEPASRAVGTGSTASSNAAKTIGRARTSWESAHRPPRTPAPPLEAATISRWPTSLPSPVPGHGQPRERRQRLMPVRASTQVSPAARRATCFSPRGGRATPLIAGHNA